MRFTSGRWSATGLVPNKHVARICGKLEAARAFMRKRWFGHQAGESGRNHVMANIVQFENVGLRYGSGPDAGPETLSDVSFTLRSGAFYFLTGASGAGPSARKSSIGWRRAATPAPSPLFAPHIGGMGATAQSIWCCGARLTAKRPPALLPEALRDPAKAGDHSPLWYTPQLMSNRSLSITLVHALTKSRTNFSSCPFSA